MQKMCSFILVEIVSQTGKEKDYTIKHNESSTNTTLSEKLWGQTFNIYAACLWNKLPDKINAADI